MAKMAMSQDEMVEQMLNAGLEKHPNFDAFYKVGAVIVCDKAHTFTLINTGKNCDWTMAKY